MFAGMIETLMAIGVVSVPVPALVVSHPPELAVPTVKFTGPPVLLTVNACAAGAAPPA
jgi:hypothetical protein